MNRLFRQVEWQKVELQPNVMTSDVRTQEGRIVQTETEYADTYNTKTFLQENQLASKARNEPLVLMSLENQAMSGVKPTSYSRQCCPTAVPVPEPSPGEPHYVNRLLARPYTAPDNMLIYLNGAPDQDRSAPTTQRGGSQVYTTRGAPAESPVQLPVPLKPETSSSLTELPRQFTLKRHQHSLLTPGASSENASWRYGIYDFDYGQKHDSRFDWRAGSGVPQPTSNIQRIVDSFSKTDAHRQFHDRFQEINPDLRENIVAGKKHIFNGFHQMELR